jgi:hypothetical protein
MSVATPVLLAGRHRPVDRHEARTAWHVAPTIMAVEGRVQAGGVGAVGKSADAATATSLAAAGDLSTAVVTAFLR